MRNCYADVAAEVDRQVELFGVQDHDDFTYLSILTEEVGETAQAANDVHFSGGDPQRVYDELVQVAAVAISFLYAIDRRGARQ